MQHFVNLAKVFFVFIVCCQCIEFYVPKIIDVAGRRQVSEAGTPVRPGATLFYVAGSDWRSSERRQQPCNFKDEGSMLGIPIFIFAY